MTKEEFICLCQEYPINLTFEKAKELVNYAIQKELNLFELYNTLYNVCKCIKIIEAQANWFDNFRKRL